MIGKTIHFTYSGESLIGEIVDKILMNTSCSVPETGYLVVATNGWICKVRVTDILKIIQ